MNVLAPLLHCYVQYHVILGKVVIVLNPLAPGRFESNFRYRQVSNIRHTESQNLSISLLVLQLSLPNPLKPGVRARIKM